MTSFQKTPKMRHFCALIVLFILFISCATKEEPSLQCLPDKGIKIARTFTDLRAGKPEKSQNFELTEYNVDGQATMIRNAKFGSETKREYKEGKLIYIIAKQTKLPDYYENEDLDSLMANGETQTDTTFVINHTKDGRPQEMKRSDGTSFLCEYTGCEMDVFTLISQKGDTLQQNQVINENGVIVKSTWFGSGEKKSKGHLTKYYNYEYDERGHWVKRTYRNDRSSPINQRRQLTYFE